MQTEFEIKVLNISEDAIRSKLNSLGATFKGKKEFRRYVYDMNPMQEEKRIRLRTDGHKTTLACKHIINPNSIDGVKEWEVIVDSFEIANELLEQIGYTAKAYQENGRESYVLDGCDIEIDSRPMIPTYLEIEGPDQVSVENMLQKLDLLDLEATSENTTEIYKHYGIDDLAEYEYISFNECRKKGN